MESIQRGGRPAAGFGVGFAPQSAFVANRGGSGKVGAFVGSAVASALAGAAAVTFFGEGTNIGGLGAVAGRLQRNWKVLAATAVAGGIIGAVVR